MRLCLFSPSLEPLLQDEFATRVRRRVGEETELVRVTNSWADPPEGADVYVSGGARTVGMRAHRRLSAAGGYASTLASRLLAPWIRPYLIEALRAADADVVVCPSRAVALQLRRVLHGADVPWSCVGVDDVEWPAPGSTHRRYDQTAKVSIVLPTFNGVRYLRESIASCLQQTHRNLELIVVDDGSSAPVEGFVREFSDPRIVFVRHQRNLGLPRSLNTGFAHATGDLCTWTSDDNTYLPAALEHMVRFLHTYPDVDFVYAESFRIDAGDAGDAEAVLQTRAPESLATENYIGACFLYKRAVYESVGDYDPRAELAEDYDYWLRVAERFTMQRIFRRLYRYRFHDASLTTTRGRQEVGRRVEAIRQLRHGSWSWQR